MSRTTYSLLEGAKAVAPIILGIVPFGLVAGAAVISAGMGMAEVVGMSLLVNAGASQIAATALFAENAPLWVVIGTALVINARLLIYSTSIAPLIGDYRGPLRPVLGHVLIDQNYAATMTWGRSRDDVSIVHYYVGAWIALASVWQLSNIAGGLLGAVIPPEWSLDFAVPLVFLAMLVPSLKKRVDAETAAVAAIGSAVLVPLLPLQTGLIAAIVLGMVWGAIRDREPVAEGVEG